MNEIAAKGFISNTAAEIKSYLIITVSKNGVTEDAERRKK